MEICKTASVHVTITCIDGQITCLMSYIHTKDTIHTIPLSITSHGPPKEGGNSPGGKIAFLRRFFRCFPPSVVWTFGCHSKPVFDHDVVLTEIPDHRPRPPSHLRPGPAAPLESSPLRTPRCRMGHPEANQISERIGPLAGSYRGRGVPGQTVEVVVRRFGRR